MRHLAVAFVALFVLALSALSIFDAPQRLPAVSELQAPAPAPQPPVQHSGVLRDASSFEEVLPPARFQGDNASVVIFGHYDLIQELCGKPDDAGFGPISCTGVKDGTPIIVAINPCIAASKELYAAILCHELGHLNGWPKTHGD